MYTCFDNMPFGAMMLDGDSLLIKYVNSKMKNILNYHNKYLLPQELIDKINILKVNRKEEYLRGYRLPLGNIVDLSISFNEGSVQVFANQVNTEDCLALKEEIDKYVSISMELKAKNDVVETLRKREKQHLMHLKDVINNISEGILVLDKEFRISLCNKSACNILDLKQIELLDYNNILVKYNICLEESSANISNYVTNFFHDKSPVKNLVLKLQDNFTNKVKYIEFNSNPILKSKGELLHTVISIKDITENKINQLIAENQARLKDEFFNVVSHELRTPLTIIYSSLQLAYDVYKEELTPNLDVALQRIKQNCSRLLKLTNNVMDISTFDAGLMKINNQQFDIVVTSELIVNSVDYYARKKGINIIFDTNEEEYDVVIDKEKYTKILLNLLSNAIKYTGENKNIYVDLILRSSKFEVHVRDEGLGIAKEDAEDIFNKYLQLNNGLTRGAEGLGLGLAVVKNFIKCMKGNIKVESKKGEGSVFILEFERYSKVNTSEVQLVTIDESFDDLITIEMSDIY